jgi:beta-lactam-binding protein with PASTA domain
VKGLGVREAVVALENAGYNVTVKGSGYVRNQTPAEGTDAKAGTKVTLFLAP